jgi:beta-glucuronidase
MKRTLGFLLLLSGLALGQSAASNLIANIPGRTTISLDGTWNTIVDPYENGLRSRFYENAKPKTKSDLVEYDFDASPKLKVPGDWNTQRESLFFYEGTVWYQRYFSYQKKDHTRLFLHFGAANYRTRVWLNGKKLGEHIGGFTPFDFEIKDEIVSGDNSLVVEVNNARHAEDVPTLSTDWWNYGGITRNVELVEVPATFIQDYFVQLAKGSSDDVAGWVRLDGGAQAVSLEIPEIGFKKNITTDASGYAAFRFPAKLKLWSPEDPKLYRVVISSADDKVEDQIGFRTIETKGAQILLNGKPVFLRGICIHEEAPFRGGRAFSPEDDRTLLTWAKELGANYVRLAHYPHNENMTRLADQMGLMVWSEIPVYWGIAWTNPTTLENAQAQLRDEIARDHNRASVILWSMSNETSPDEVERTEFLKALAQSARSWDGTRLITSALNHWTTTGNTRLMNDPLGEYLDVLGINEYIGWYEKTPEDADVTEWKSTYNKPAVISEFGAEAVYSQHGDAQTRFTEEYQVNVFQHQIAMWKKVPFVAGMSPWLLMDFHSPRRQLVGVQDFYNRKGLISDRGQKKQAFYVLQKFYEEMSGQAH